jgi:hypothetical protein
MPDDFNELLCHVLGKPPKTLTPEGVLRRGPADTRIIEVGSTENRIIARGVCRVLTHGPVGDWFDPDQHAWLPGRYALQAVMRVDFEQSMATMRGDDGPLGLGDLEKAFPSVLLDGLWTLLHFLGAPPDFLRLLQNLYNKVQRWGRGRQRQYTWGQSTRGLKTGCGLSTVLLLFAMLVLGTAIRRHLRRTDPTAGTVLFADDFAWLRFGALGGDWTACSRWHDARWVYW